MDGEVGEGDDVDVDAEEEGEEEVYEEIPKATMYRWVSRIEDDSAAGTLYSLFFNLLSFALSIPISVTHITRAAFRMASRAGYDANHSYLSSIAAPVDPSSLDKGKAKEGGSKRMIITFSIPTSALAPYDHHERRVSEIHPAGGGDAMEVDTVARSSAPKSDAISGPEVVEGRGPGTCAIEGCGNARKYRLVKDWKVGACGLPHLKALEGR